MDSINENVIEWISGKNIASVTLSQRKYVSKFERLAKEFPSNVQVLERNKDGSIFGHISLSAISFNRLAFINKGISPVSVEGREDE